MRVETTCPGWFAGNDLPALMRQVPHEKEITVHTIVQCNDDDNRPNVVHGLFKDEADAESWLESLQDSMRAADCDADGIETVMNSLTIVPFTTATELSESAHAYASDDDVTILEEPKSIMEVINAIDKMDPTEKAEVLKELRGRTH